MDLTDFRALFPALQHLVWLNSAAGPPGARPVVDAMQAYLDGWQNGRHGRGPEDHADIARGLFARLVGAPADCIGLLDSLSECAATVAASLPPGRVVVGEREYRSNLFPWLALADRGCEVVAVPPVRGAVPTDALLEALTPGTALLAVTEVQSSNGYRVDLPRLVERARAVGARVFVNLTQSAGVLPFSVRDLEPDYVAAHGYKWLLGPRGAAYLYVAPRFLGETRPLAPNPNTGGDFGFYGAPYAPAASARRLDSSGAWLAWVGARAGLEIIHALDPGAVQEHCLGLAAAFRRGALSRGFEVAPQELPSQIEGVLVSDPEQVNAELERRGVIASVRDGYVRVGFHAFNTVDDVAAALDGLTAGRDASA